MLWRKAWLETRGRLLLAIAMLAFICAVIVLFGDGARQQAAGSMPFTVYIWNGVYKDYARNVFVVLVIVMGGGTLLQEVAHGTAAFTLSLPATRRRLLLSRASVGLFEVGALAIVPALLIPALSTFAGQQYPLTLAARFALLWAAGGILILSVSLLWASVLSNEYVAWTASFLSLMLGEAIVNYTVLSSLPSLDVLKLMNGMTWPSFDPAVAELHGAPPWASMAGMMIVAMAVVLVTDRIHGRRDYA